MTQNEVEIAITQLQSRLNSVEQILGDTRPTPARTRAKVEQLSKDMNAVKADIVQVQIAAGVAVK